MLSLCEHVKQTALALGLAVGLLGFSGVAFAQAPVNQHTSDINEVTITFVNNGIVGLDVVDQRPGGFWPRSSQNPGMYLFGSGVWFGARVDQGDGDFEKHVFLTYNPTSSRSWAAPGDVGDGPEIVTDPDVVEKYYMYNSADYMSDGQAIGGQLPAWPLWNPNGTTVGPRFGNLGSYVADISERSFASQASGPVFISDQDLICRYKSTDVSLYGFPQPAAAPLSLQFEQAAYAWADPARENFVLVRYDVTNVGDKVTHDCHFAYAGDFDIGDPINLKAASGDDRLDTFIDAADRPLVGIWSGDGSGPNDARFGYFGVAMLQSPAVDETGFLRDDVDPSDYESQIGLTTVRSWVIQNDPIDNEERYDFISAQIYEGSFFSGNDRRLIFGSGPFNLRPGETARFVIGFFFAPSVGPAPDGSEEDIANLVDEVNKGTQTWTDLAVSVHDTQGTPAFNIQLSPNPASNMLTVETEGLPGIVTAQLDIVDASGRVLISQNVTVDPASGLRQELDLNSLPAGTYFCRLRMGEYTHSESFALVH